MVQEAQSARPRCAKAPSRRTGHGRRPCLAKGARAPADEATVACHQSGMYPTFDSAAGSGEIPVFFGILPYLILRVTWFDSASGPIPVNVPHCSGCRVYNIFVRLLHRKNDFLLYLFGKIKVIFEPQIVLTLLTENNTETLRERETGQRSHAWGNTRARGARAPVPGGGTLLSLIHI